MEISQVFIDCIKYEHAGALTKDNYERNGGERDKIRNPADVEPAYRECNGQAAIRLIMRTTKVRITASSFIFKLKIE